MQPSPRYPLWLLLRPLTVVLLVAVCGRFVAGQEAVDGKDPSELSPVNSATSGFELKMKPEDSSFTRAMGSSFVFTCEISGEDRDSTTNYNLKWFHNSTEITDKTASRMYVEDEGTVVKKLYITGFEKTDEGAYKCTGMIGGVAWEKSTNVFIFKDITFDHAPAVQHPAIYTDAVIECRVIGRPKPELSWRYKGDRIQAGGRYKIVEEEGLRITNVTLEDDGLYLCRAEVEADGRYGEEKITVAVHIPPKIVEGFGTANAIEGGEISVFCRAEGLPAPEFQFYKIKDGATVAVEATDRVQVDAKAGTLAFRPLKKEDEGDYSCRAHNDVGNDTKEIKVEVLVKPAIFDLQNVTSDEGTIRMIICSARGDPKPTMTFRKAGSAVNYVVGENEDQRLVVSGPEDGRLSLQFNSLIRSDSGDYICRAESNIGSDEQTARLTVNYRPRFETDHPKLVHIWAGTTRNMTCNVEGEPVPVMEWLRGNEPITNNSTYTIFNNERTSNLQVTVLEADQIWIYGNYTCKASNELGTNDVKIELRRATVPDSPQSVNVTECLPNSIVIQVEPPAEDGGEKVRGYRVEYSEKVQNTSVIIGSEVGEQIPEYNEIPKSLEVLDSDTITVENLKPNTTYLVRVKAKNDVGVSSPKELTVTTKSVQKPSPIQIDPSTKGEAFSYTITWKKPITGGLPIKEYEFKFRTVSVEEDGTRKFGGWKSHIRPDDVNQPMLTYELNDLTPGATYDLQVRAKNDLGWSDDTSAQFETRAASPSEVAAVQASINPGTVVAIVVVIFVVLLVVVDVSCYFINHCGVTMCICVHLCGRSSAFTKEKAMEEGESKEVLKQPIETYQPEEGVADGQTQLPPPAYNENDCKEQCLKSDDDKETQKEKDDLKESLKEGIEPEKEKEKELDAADDVKVVSGAAEEKTEKAPAV